jgi:hypothetical protein
MNFILNVYTIGWISDSTALYAEKYFLPLSSRETILTAVDS